MFNESIDTDWEGHILDENLTKAVSDITGLVAKIAGPLAHETGLLLADKAREYRIRNAIRIFQRVRKMFVDAGIDPHPIASRLFLPAFDAASIEDNETLQERWAALLANASNPETSNTVSPAFVEVLKQLTPEEAMFLDRIIDRVTRKGKFKPHITDTGIKLGNFNDTLQLFAGDKHPYEILNDERLRERAVLAFDNLIRLGIINRVLLDENTLRRIANQVSDIRSMSQLKQLFSPDTGFYLTPFGLSFIHACTPPKTQRSEQQ